MKKKGSITLVLIQRKRVVRLCPKSTEAFFEGHAAGMVGNKQTNPHVDEFCRTRERVALGLAWAKGNRTAHRILAEQ